jgi:hypothetical protein
MSAFNVNKDTIDLLVSAWYWTGDGHYMPELITDTTPRTAGLDTFMEAAAGYSPARLPMGRTDGTAKLSALGGELVAENNASVNARYGENTEPEAYNYTPLQRMENWQAVVLGAIHCYEYQACETEEWEQTFAYAYCQRLRRNITSLIGVGYWEFNRDGALV